MNTALFYTGMIIAAVLMGVSLVYAVMYRRERGVRYFVGLLFSRVIYASGVIMELQLSTLAEKEWCRSIQQMSLVLCVPLFLLFVLDLHHRDKWLTPIRQLLIFSPFVLWVILIASNGHTGLVFSELRLVDGYLEVVRTPLAIAVNLLCFMLIGIGLVFVIRYIRDARPDVRKAGMWVLALCCVPVLFELAKLAAPELGPWLLPISVYTGFLGMIMLWLIVRNRLFSVVPMARQQIIDTRQEGFLIVDNRGRIVDCNGYMEPLFADQGAPSSVGLLAKEVLEKWPNWAEAVEQMRSDRMEVRGRLAGDDRVFILDVHPLMSQRGKQHGTVSVMFDITEKQRHLEQIAALNQLKDQMITVVSHDIRDPLALQVSLIELIEEERVDMTPVQQELVQTLSEQVRSTYLLVDNLLEWFRIQKEGFVLQEGPVRIADVVREACDALRLRSEVKQIAVRTEVPAAMTVRADREALLLIVRNLLSNAIKFSKRGAVVRIMAYENATHWVLDVQDAGIGMDAKQIGRLHDEVHLNAMPGTEGEKGAGLGLIVSARFLRLAGGRLKVESAPGQGSTFSVMLEKKGDTDDESVDHR